MKSWAYFSIFKARPINDYVRAKLTEIISMAIKLWSALRKDRYRVEVLRWQWAIRRVLMYLQPI